MNSTNGRLFLDTNVLVYTIDRREPVKRARMRELLGRVPTDQIVVSTQTLLEFVAVTRKKTLVPFDQLRKLLQMYLYVDVVRVEPGDILEAVEIMSETQLRVFDCMMIVAASKAGCAELWSEDMNHGQIVRGVRIVNPFREDTEST